MSLWKKDSRYGGNDSKGAGAAPQEPQEKVSNYVVSKYVDNPFLVGGKKFDLRLYVLVTSYSPLTIWMYRNGFARFSKTRFSMNSADLSNQFVHLTNNAIQKVAPG